MKAYKMVDGWNKKGFINTGSNGLEKYSPGS